MATPSKLNLDELATNIVGCFPRLNLLEQQLFLRLVSPIADGQAGSSHGDSGETEDFVEQVYPYLGPLALACCRY